MGFSALLQGKTSHEALLSLQDAEIRLLENIKRCLGFRVKCDREYAIAINTMCLQAQKSDLSHELNGSLIAKAWKTIVEETEAFGRLVKQNADHIACITIEKLNFLITEKRNCRKMYMDERNKIEAELFRLQDTVVKGKQEYEKCLDNFKLAKVKYDEQIAKGRTGKKVDEVKEKYVKACRKLHRIHNDYVLWLCEAVEYEKSFRTVLLPSLLEYHQILQEEMVDQCKTVLTEFVQYTNLSANKFQELHGHMSENVKDINPVMEYKEFMNKYKSPPPLPVAFIFDRVLIDDYNGRLRPNTVTVDDLTFTFLKLKMAEFEDKSKECQRLIKEKQNELIKLENEFSSLRKSAEMAPTLFIKRKTIELLRHDLLETRMKEQKYQRQNDIITGPISKIGDAGPPRALNFNGESTTQEQESTSRLERLKLWHVESTGTLSKLHSRNFVDMIRKPFMKRQSFHAMSTFNLKEAVEEKSSRASTTSRSAPSSPIQTKLVAHPDQPLQDEEWFHGVLPREEVVRLLQKDGQYLVRETLRNDEQQIVLSVRWQGHKHFIVQITTDGKYRFEGPAFPTIQELMLYQHRSGLPVTNKSGAILKIPVFRERWELNNDDVELLTKIGRGNFGDVYKARLKSNGQEVAAKTCHITLPDEQKKKFLQEGRILKQYDHPNIVKLIGICVQKQPIMIVMELVPGGSLLSFLRNSGSSLSVIQKVIMSINCAAGMEYLESKNCIHRDLAARNCLIGKENVVKISDFGMSREEEEYVVSDGMKQIPIKWTAPEALNFGKYTALCDVWSYGVLVWEIFSNGGSPYSGLSNTKAREMVDSGYRMPAPDGTPDPVYRLMIRCWEYDCELRPRFAELHSSLNKILLDLKATPEPADN